MAVTLKGQTAVYEGTSTDTKPTDADNNAIFKELDTGIRYYYDGTNWNEIPSSGGGGGGGTGTDNYNELNNKPSINGTTLSGNKSLDNLGIQAKLTFDSAPTEDSENPVKSGGVYSALAGKQDTISDLSTIRSGAAAGASAVQPAAMEAALAQKQDAISDLSTIRSGAAAGATAVQPATLETALAGKQDALSSEQLDAVNSGITSADVEQITTNKNNILLIAGHYKYDDRQLYLQEAIATENIVEGSTWIDRKTISSYTESTNIVGGEIEQGAWLTPSFGKSDANNRCRLSNSMAVIAGNAYTITLNNPVINNARILIHYRGADKKTLSETGWQSTIPYTFTPPSNCEYITIAFSNSANTNCTPSDFGDLQINKGSTAQTYASPAWS